MTGHDPADGCAGSCRDQGYRTDPPFHPHGAATPASCGRLVGPRSLEESEIVAQQSSFYQSCFGTAAPTPVLLFNASQRKRKRSSLAFRVAQGGVEYFTLIL